MATKHVWDQQPDEPTKAYKGFLVYRSMGEERSYAKVAPNLGLSASQVEKLGGEFNWVHRADQWDAWKEGLRNRALEASEKRKAAVEALAVNDLAQAARLQARRMLNKMRRQKPTRSVWRQVRELGDDGKMKEEWRFVEEPNPHYVESPGTVLALVTGATSLVKLMRGEPGSLDEKQKASHREQLLQRLEQMAASIQGKTPPQTPPAA